jgi:hypothetical protein
MKKVGLICDLLFTKHMQFRNYYYALSWIYGSVKLVKSREDLPGLDILFVGDYFYGYHWSIVTDFNIHQKPLPYIGGEDFVKRLDELDITLVLLCTEKLLGDTHYTHAVPTYNILKKCKKFYHYAYDVDDVRLLGNKLHRFAMSWHYMNWIRKDIVKKDRIIFIGCMYKWRKEVIDFVKDRFPLDVFQSTITSWEEYMELIAGYRFVLSPLGNANGLVTKFYEILLVHSIPIQQVKSDTLQYYDIEAGFKDCIYFESLDELPNKITQCTLQRSESEIWLENYLIKLLKEDNLL